MRRSVVGAACAVACALSFGCSSDPLTLTVTVPSDPTPADGKTGAKIEVKVAQGDTVINTGIISFKSDLDGSSFTPIEDTTELPSTDEQQFETSVSAGSASARLYSIRNKAAKVVVSYTDENSGAVTTKDVSVVFGGGTSSEVGSIKFVSADPEVLQLAESGGSETSNVTFEVLDTSGIVMQGVEVEFTLGTDLGGATIDPPSATSNDSGLVSTTLSSGTQYGTVKIKAATKDGSVTGESIAVTVAGGSANYNNFDFVCSRKAIAGFSKTGLTMTCSAHVADHSAQKLLNYPVAFSVEAGAIDSQARTDELGTAPVNYKTQDPEPIDVVPNLAYVPLDLIDVNGGSREPSQPCPLDPGKTCNPRDGVVTAIAVTTGEEAWSDDNRNGTWDDGERFTDLSEPYIDINDNEQYDGSDPAEKSLYVDVNHNGHFDGPNGKWDRATQIWKATKFVWTGGADEFQSGFYGMDGQRIPSLTITHCGADKRLQVLAVDARLNFLSNNEGEAMVCGCDEGECTSAPDEMLLGHELFGKKFLEFRAGDSHTCSPDCLTEDPPSCERMNGTLRCVADFGMDDEEGGYAHFDVSMDVVVE